MVQINERDKNWLLGHFTENAYGKPLRGLVTDDYLSAEKILKGLEKKRKLSCGCHRGSLKRMVDQLYDELVQKENNG